jgi:hypothetical protein
MYSAAPRRLYGRGVVEWSGSRAAAMHAASSHAQGCCKAAAAPCKFMLHALRRSATELQQEPAVTVFATLQLSMQARYCQALPRLSCCPHL